MYLRYLQLPCQSDMIKKLQSTEPCSNSSWRESQEILKGTKGSCLDKWLWRAEWNHSWAYAFTCFPFPFRLYFFPNACQLTPKSSDGKLLSLSVALLLCSASGVDLLRRPRVLLVILCSTYCKIYPWFCEGASKKKVHISLSYKPNLKLKIQMIHSQPPPNLFNSVLYVQSRNLKNSFWLSWTVVQL